MHLAVLLGEATPGRDIEGEARENFRAPVSGVDWVLVIDNGDLFTRLQEKI